MRGKPITLDEIERIISLRRTGHSLPEIMKNLNRGSATVFKYSKGVDVLPSYISILKAKQGGSKRKAEIAWEVAHKKTQKMLGSTLSKSQRLCVLASLYWGEGNKKELNMINSDPDLIKIFILCLGDIGVQKDEIKIGLRLHQNINKEKAIVFWSKHLTIRPDSIKNFEIIKAGKKKGKLEFGMCRVRVAKSARYFKLLMSLIHEIKRQLNAPVVQWIE